jgi:hypothetical protein
MFVKLWETTWPMGLQPMVGTCQYFSCNLSYVENICTRMINWEANLVHSSMQCVGRLWDLLCMGSLGWIGW